MQKPIKLGVFVAFAALALCLVAFLVVNKLSISLTSQTYQVNDAPLQVTPDAADAPRGEHLVRAVLGCTSCHGSDLAGQTLVQSRYVGTLRAANLTRPPRTADQLVRAIRYGVHDDGHGLWLMPTEAYAGISDADLAAVIAYLRGLTPLDRDLPAPRLALGGRFDVVSRRLVLIQAGAALPTEPPAEPAPNAAYGAYLARIARCQSCHGPQLRGIAGAPDISAEALSSWHLTDFFRALRDGKTPAGETLSDAMPWRQFAGLTDLEITALWEFMQKS